MDLGALFLLLGILIIVVLFVAQPFTSNWRVKAQSSREISSLLAERERALNSIQELDFDHELGKVPAQEYDLQRVELLQRGVDTLRRLDELQAKQIVSVKLRDQSPKIENARKKLSDEELEELISKRRTAQLQKPAGFCPKCGKPVSETDKFCPSCGQVLTPPQSQPSQ